jgi:hypothetical protein
MYKLIIFLYTHSQYKSHIIYTRIQHLFWEELWSWEVVHCWENLPFLLSTIR